MPAVKEYREYLENDYLPKARESLSVAENPDGKDCYCASLRFYTMLDSTPKEIFDLGMKTVKKNRKQVEELGKELFGISQFPKIIETVNSNPSD